MRPPGGFPANLEVIENFKHSNRVFLQPLQEETMTGPKLRELILRSSCCSRAEEYHLQVDPGSPGKGADGQVLRVAVHRLDSVSNYDSAQGIDGVRDLRAETGSHWERERGKTGARLRGAGYLWTAGFASVAPRLVVHGLHLDPEVN